MRHLAGCGGMDPKYPALPCRGCAPRSDGLSEMGRWDSSGFEADGDGLWVRERSPRCFIVIRFTDLAEHIPESERGPEFNSGRYDATVSLVDLDAIGRSELTQALDGLVGDYSHWEECGTCKGSGTLELVYYSGPCSPDCFQGSIVPPRAQAEECIRYGLHGPVGGDAGGNLRQVLRSARREANHLLADADALEQAMSKPVNRLGSTAAEFMRGDMDAALSRGLAQGDTTARIMGQMASPLPPSGAIRMDVKMGQVPSDDPIAYSMGFLHGYQGSALPAEQGDLADAYLEGRKQGADVRIGRSPIPDWVS